MKTVEQLPCPVVSVGQYEGREFSVLHQGKGYALTRLRDGRREYVVFDEVTELFRVVDEEIAACRRQAIFERDRKEIRQLVRHFEHFLIDSIDMAGHPDYLTFVAAGFETWLDLMTEEGCDKPQPERSALGDYE